MTEQTNIAELPAGYVSVFGVAVHVAKLRKYSKDVHRFRRYLPLAEELVKHEPHSPEWIDLVEHCVSPNDLALTHAEASRLLNDCGRELVAEYATRNPGPEAA